MSRTLVPVILLFAVATAAAEPPPTVPYVDLERYRGTWYELARLPAWFQRDCLQSRAVYEPLSPGRLSVVNSCPTADGKTKVARGSATVVDPVSNARLEVVFDNWFSRLFPWLVKGDYWILDLSPDYRTVIVGTPDRKYLWIMAREPSIPEETYRALVERATDLGFATDRLLRLAPPKP